jgi:hypothetical protein
VTRAILDRAASEEEVLLAVTEALSWHGYRWTHIRRSDKALTMGSPGLPDLIAVRGPRLIAAELKAERGRFTADQSAWLDALVRVEEVDARVVRPSTLDAFLCSLEERE